MKKILELTLIVIFVFSSLKANATVLSDPEVRAAISKHVVENYKKYTTAEITAEVVGLSFKELVLPNGKITFVVKSSADKFMARDLEKVNVYVNNQFVKTFTAPVVVKAYQNVLVASCIINRETLLNPNIVRVEKREVSNTLGYALEADEINKEIITRKFFSEGEVIDKRFVKLKPDVLRNANVTVVFNTNNLSISTEAVALTDGTVGENICVMNKNYNKIYKGTIIGENKVLVKI